MAMTLRLNDDDHARLESAAKQAGVSMHSLAVEAIRNELQRRPRQEEITEIADSIRRHHRDLLDRLAE